MLNHMKNLSINVNLTQNVNCFIIICKKIRDFLIFGDVIKRKNFLNTTFSESISAFTLLLEPWANFEFSQFFLATGLNILYSSLVKFILFINHLLSEIPNSVIAGIDGAMNYLALLENNYISNYVSFLNVI